jgi:methyltransferase (TIGR00027 family)
MHVQLDPPPHVMEDVVGLKLIAPEENWRQRPDMDPEATRGFRAGVAARARYVEDLVAEQVDRGVTQYVLLGAGLDTFAQRRPDLAARLRVFEVDQPGPQLWKRERLVELGLGIPAWLRFVPVDFEAGQSWWEQLVAAGFVTRQPAVVASAGVSMYLSRHANLGLLRQVDTLARGSTLALTFLLPLDLIDPEERPFHQMLHERARASGTPFISFFSPDEMVTMALDAGFREARHVSTADLNARYFNGRADGLQVPTGESFLVATV